MICPKCGSKAIKLGFTVKRGGKVQRYQCEQGHIFTEK
jgi:transposase-like protein